MIVSSVSPTGSAVPVLVVYAQTEPSLFCNRSWRVFTDGGLHHTGNLRCEACAVGCGLGTNVLGRIFVYPSGGTNCMGLQH